MLNLSQVMRRPHGGIKSHILNFGFRYSSVVNSMLGKL